MGSMKQQQQQPKNNKRKKEGPSNNRLVRFSLSRLQFKGPTACPPARPPSSRRQSVSQPDWPDRRISTYVCCKASIEISFYFLFLIFIVSSKRERKKTKMSSRFDFCKSFLNECSLFISHVYRNIEASRSVGRSASQPASLPRLQLWPEPMCVCVCETEGEENEMFYFVIVYV